MYADEQDRISSPASAAGSQRRPLWIDAVVIGIILLVAAVFAYRYFADFEPDYTSLPTRDSGRDSDYTSSDYDSNPGDTQTYPVDGEDSNVASAPAPLEDPEVKEQYELPEKSPQLNNSDEDLLSQLRKLSSLQGVVAWSDAQDLARRFVVLVYNLAEGDVAHRYLPLSSPKEKFRVLGQGKSLRIDPASFDRYTLYSDAFAAMDSDRAVSIYRFFYPALEAAFAELGEPQKSLHKELLIGIDHLLQTPDLSGDIYLVQPSVYYKFADPAVEALSPAQKQMLRLGPANRALVKAKLEEIKQLLLAAQ